MMLAITQEEPSGKGAVLREGEGGVPPGEPPQAQEDLPGHHTGVRYRILIQVSDTEFSYRCRIGYYAKCSRIRACMCSAGQRTRRL